MAVGDMGKFGVIGNGPKGYAIIGNMPTGGDVAVGG